MANYKVEIKFTNGESIISEMGEDKAQKLADLYADSNTETIWFGGLIFKPRNVLYIKATLENQQDG